MAKATEIKKPRIRKLDRKLARKKAKSDVQKREKIIGSFRLTAQTLSTIRRFWKPLGGITLVYLLLSLILASGFTTIGTAIDNLNFNNAISGGGFSNAFSGFGSLFDSLSSARSSIFQPALVVIGSLAFIWALRQLLADNRIKVKQAYYSSMYPLIPFLLVCLVIIIQLLPIILGTALLTVLLSAVNVSELVLTVVALIFFAAFSLWSLYMLSSSIFALYIVTLPDMQPRQALRSAKTLTRFRRWSLMRRLLFLPVFILIASAVLLVPLVAFAAPAAAIIFYLLLTFALLFTHTYLYSLYRSLL